ncbi:MAG: hypothetical protein HY558_07455 [Euryarchaeota archaeon]|nr:hypothetical protein [Euryarchaeota archaeon]
MRDVLEQVKEGKLTVEQAEAELRRRADAPVNPLGTPEPLGQVVQYEPPEEPSRALVGVMAALTACEVLFDMLVVLWIVNRWDQMEASLWAGMAFLILAVLLLLYWRYMLPDEIIIKKRRWKQVPNKNEPWSPL